MKQPKPRAKFTQRRADDIFQSVDMPLNRVLMYIQNGGLCDLTSKEMVKLLRPMLTKVPLAALAAYTKSYRKREAPPKDTRTREMFPEERV